MSIAAINAATKLLADPECDLQPRPRLVLMLLANFAGKDGKCHPSRRRLAEMAKASEASIKRDLAELELRKIIKREERYNPATGARAPSHITIVLANGSAHYCEPPSGQGYDPATGQGCDPPPRSMVIPTNKAEPTNEPTIEPSVVTTAAIRNQQIDPAEICQKLMAEANGALNPLAKGLGLQNVSEPIGWIQSGADFELDILPAVREVSHRTPPGSIQSWGYYRGPVADRKARRERGLPQPSVHLSNGSTSRPSHMRRFG